jgi:glycosyltransferase involved in cell wall biosynthesis
LAAPHRVLIVSEHPYPGHATVSRNVAQLLDEGIRVDLVCLASPRPLEGTQPDRAGLRVYQMRMEHRRTGALRYVWEYFAFFLWALPLAAVLSVRHRYTAVLVDNLPDFLVFVALVARWRGARVVLEMFELTPELMAARLRMDHRHPMLRWTRWIERIATRWPDHVIAVSQQCKDILVARGVDAGKISVVPNTPSVAVGPTDPESVATNAPFIVTHCSLVERYGVQVAVRALELMRRDWPDLTLRVLGDGEYKADLIDLSRELGLADRVVFRGFVPWAEAMAEISQASVGIVAIIADGYGELLLPTKLLEYVEHEVPVVCARLPTIAHHFPADSVAYFEPGDPAGLAAQANRLLCDRREAKQQARRAKLAMRSFSWDALAPRYMAALGLDRVELAANVAV